MPNHKWTRYQPWAVVTGASSGIGAEFARQLGALGFDVVLAARRRERMEALAAEIGAQRREVRVVEVDLATAEGCDTLLSETAALDVGLVVANAGLGAKGRFVEMERDELLQMVDLNCLRTTHLVHGFAQRLIARRRQRGQRGGLIITASTAAFQGIPLTTVYAASKGFDLQLAEGLYHELKPLGVDVLALCPGPTDTEGPARTGVIAERVPNQMPVEPVVRAALNGLGRQVVVVPGFVNKLGALSVRWVTRALAAKIAGRMISRVTELPLVGEGEG